MDSAPASSGANFVSFFMAGAAGVAWYTQKIGATSRLENLKANLRELDQLYAELCEQTRAVSLSADEQEEMEKRSQTVKSLKKRLRDIEDDMMSVTGPVAYLKEYWQWGELISALTTLNVELRTVYKDLLSTTRKINARDPVLTLQGSSTGPSPFRGEPFQPPVRSDENSGAPYYGTSGLPLFPPQSHRPDVTRRGTVAMC